MKVTRSRPAANFTQVLNDVLRDPQLDPFVLGVLVRMLSRPDGWSTTADDMWKQARQERPAKSGARGEGRDTYRRAFAKLEETGYLERQRNRAAGGQWDTTLILHDSPHSPTTAHQASVPPAETGVCAGGTDDGSPGVGPPGVKELTLTTNTPKYARARGAAQVTPTPNVKPKSKGGTEEGTPQGPHSEPGESAGAGLTQARTDRGRAA